MLRDDQLQLLTWVVQAVHRDSGSADRQLASLPDWELPRFQAAGIASGLTAAIGVLAEHHGCALPAAWRAFVADQVATVAQRQHQFATLASRTLTVLADAGVDAVPVKGAVLATTVWSTPAARPMADLDLVVRPADRAAARIALRAAGLAMSATNDWEDTFLGWGDGSAGPTDRESTEHNGKVEVHPGFVDRLHDYVLDSTAELWSHATPGTLHGAPCLLLGRPALAAHVLTHLSACAARAEVRAVNVVDLVLLLDALSNASADELREFASICDRLDARLTAPGLWLVAAVAALPPSIDAVHHAQRHRLPRAAQQQLNGCGAADVLRQHGARTSLRWRLAFAHTTRQRVAVIRQALLPRRGDLVGGETDTATWRLHLRRASRLLTRVTGR